MAMGGRDHACDVCGHGGLNDPDGSCICHKPHPVVKNADFETGERIIRAWELGFGEGLEAARNATFEIAMPEDWMQRASDAGALS